VSERRVRIRGLCWAGGAGWRVAWQFLRATFATMLSQRAYFFAYFWFSPHPAAGEANA
jgi:hypothetical protein